MNRTVSVFILISVCFILFFFRLGNLGLTDPDEARYAESAREMLELKSPIIPYFNYEPRINKPILFYWFLCLSYILFGISEFGARLPSAFFAAMGVLLTYKTAQKIFQDERLAFLSSLILASSLEYLIFARLCTIDMALTFFITLALFSYFCGYLKLFYAGVAFAFLAKGPVAVILPSLIVFTHLLLTKNLKQLRALQLPKGIALFLVITAPWYLLCYINQLGVKGSIRLLSDETLKRFFIGFEHPEPFYYFVPVIIAGFLPWIFFLPQAIAHTLKNISNNDRRDVWIFLLSWIAVVFLFFSVCRDKLSSYILPLYPALAILIANWWNAKIAASHKVKFAFAAIIAGITISGLLSVIYVLPIIETRRSTKHISSILANTVLPSQEVVPFKVFKPSMVFYLKRQLRRINDDSEFVKLFKSPQAVFFYINKNDIAYIRDLVGISPNFVTAEGKIAVISNIP